MDPCPYCGGLRLVTLHEEGSIVCGDCGVVLEESMIDDGAPPRRREPEKRGGGPYVRGGRLPRGIRRAVKQALRHGCVLHGDRVYRYSDVLAESVVAGDPELAEAYEAVKGIRGIGRRRPRVLAGLAAYIVLRSRGLSKSRSLALAASMTRSSPATLKRLEKDYRDALEGVVASLSERRARLYPL